MDNVSLCQLINRIPLVKYRYIGCFPCDYVPTRPNDTFAIINTQPSNMQGEHWIMIACFVISYSLLILLVAKTTTSSAKTTNG